MNSKSVRKSLFIISIAMMVKVPILVVLFAWLGDYTFAALQIGWFWIWFGAARWQWIWVKQNGGW